MTSHMDLFGQSAVGWCLQTVCLRLAGHSLVRLGGCLGQMNHNLIDSNYIGDLTKAKAMLERPVDMDWPISMTLVQFQSISEIRLFQAIEPNDPIHSND